jgi:hypothetical protein
MSIFSFCPCVSVSFDRSSVRPSVGFVRSFRRSSCGLPFLEVKGDVKIDCRVPARRWARRSVLVHMYSCAHVAPLIGLTPFQQHAPSYIYSLCICNVCVCGSAFIQRAKYLHYMAAARGDTKSSLLPRAPQSNVRVSVVRHTHTRLPTTRPVQATKPLVTCLCWNKKKNPKWNSIPLKTNS